MTVCGRTKAVRCLPFDRFVVVCTLLEVLLYLSASVVWPTIVMPSGECPWDSKLVVAVFSFVNFGLYVADLVYSQTIRYTASRPGGRGGTGDFWLADVTNL
ncbi:hypothetical protein F7725_016079 [Dissostichus mawsoni]|uniref:Myeloid-associated differentiation marker-like protein 2 n=1 Tax=Dissostichus mawsoni TaxID=36200 RepID=A0A7J5Y4R3_DISMA|nr:hypothetical protein F7725_016079 [Dissostichus mawsoni]